MPPALTAPLPVAQPVAAPAAGPPVGPVAPEASANQPAAPVVLTAPAVTADSASAPAASSPQRSSVGGSVAGNRFGRQSPTARARQAGSAVGEAARSRGEGRGAGQGHDSEPAQASCSAEGRATKGRTKARAQAGAQARRQEAGASEGPGRPAEAVQPGRMKRPAAALLTGGAVAVLLAFTIVAPAEACTKPTGLSFDRKAGQPAGKLSWKTPRRGHFRVYRNQAIVGQVIGRSIRVAVKPGRKYVFVVRAVTGTGALASCTARLKQRMQYFAPFRPRGLAVKNVRARSAVLEWGRAKPGDGKLQGYRIYRSGKVYKQVKRLSARVKLGLAPSYRFAVAAADTRGHVGRRTRTLLVVRWHKPPSRPGELRANRVTDSEVDLSWSASRAGSARVIGYRIYRNGELLGQRPGLSGSATNLAPATPYGFSVAAIDAAGYLSEPLGPAAVQTAMPRPRRERRMPSCLPPRMRASATSGATTGRSARSTRRTSTAAHHPRPTPR